MKLLLDQNLSAQLAEHLRASGFMAEHVSAVGMRSAEDPEILEFAQRSGYTIVSQDSDFGMLIARLNASGPSIVQLRGVQAVAARDIGALLSANLPQLTDTLEAGAITTVTNERIRIRHLPVSP